MFSSVVCAGPQTTVTEFSSWLTQHDLRVEIFYAHNSEKGKTETCNVFKTSVSRGGSDRTTLEKFQPNDHQEFLLAHGQEDTKQQQTRTWTQWFRWFFPPLNYQTGVLDLSSSDGAEGVFDSLDADF